MSITLELKQEVLWLGSLSCKYYYTKGLYTSCYRLIYFVAYVRLTGIEDLIKCQSGMLSNHSLIKTSYIVQYLVKQSIHGDEITIMLNVAFWIFLDMLKPVTLILHCPMNIRGI